MRKRSLASIAVVALFAVSATLGAALGNGLGSAKPTLIEQRFDLPTDRPTVSEAWLARGFSKPTITVYPRGWSRAEHAHSDDLLVTLTTGRMEFTIAGHRVVIEPGDELFYPARAVMLARNLHDGDSRALISRRR